MAVCTQHSPTYTYAVSSFVVRTCASTCASTWLSGPFPSLALLPAIVNIDLTNNAFTDNVIGVILSTVGIAGVGAPLLETMRMGSNLFDGTLADPVVTTNLTHIDVSYNLLSGSIPTFRTANSLETLILSHNKLTDIVPPELGLLNPTILTTIALDANKLVGTLPLFTQNDHPPVLKVLNFSHNNFRGMVQLNWFKSTTLSVDQGNGNNRFFCHQGSFASTSFNAISSHDCATVELTTMQCVSQYDPLRFVRTGDCTLNLASEGSQGFLDWPRYGEERAPLYSSIIGFYIQC